MRLTILPSANLVLPDQDLFLITGALNDGNTVRPDAVSKKKPSSFKLLETIQESVQTAARKPAHKHTKEAHKADLISFVLFP